MSIVSLARDEKDLRRRILDISLGRRKKSQKRVSIRELKVSAGVFSLLERVLCPNLVTANNRTPVFMHTGVFANISHGNSSVVADRIAMRLSDYVVSEAGFGTAGPAGTFPSATFWTGANPGT
jgi:formate--tetrahydrofolate ligase